MLYSVSSELYAEVAARLIEAIGDGGYFSGSLAFVFGDAECRLTASVIAYRERMSLPDGTADLVADTVPVWWEFHTTVDGEERLNDFSFAELRSWLR